MRAVSTWTPGWCHNTLTAIRYQDETLGPTVRPCAYGWVLGYSGCTTMVRVGRDSRLPLTLMFIQPKFNGTTLWHYVSVHPTLLKCTSDCPGTQWALVQIWLEISQNIIHHLIRNMPNIVWYAYKHVGPYKLLRTILSCNKEILAKWTTIFFCSCKEVAVLLLL